VTRCNMTTSRQTSGKRWRRIARWRQRVERTRGGGSATQGQRNNQLANKRHSGGQASADKRWRNNERTRGGGGATRGITTTSQKMRVKRGEAPAEKRGRRLESRWQLKTTRVKVVQQEYKRRRQHIVRTRGKGGGGGQATTGQSVRADYPSSAFLVLAFVLSYAWFCKSVSKGRKEES
jgi:hypothetical protein